MILQRHGRWVFAAALLLASSAAIHAQADKLVVTHYAGALNGLPYTIALEKGYFKDAGVNITGIIGGAGGGSGVRSLLAGGSLYAEVALPAAITAARQGLDIKIINSCGEGWDQIWVTRPDAPLNSAKDLRGKRLAYSRPRSVSEMFLLLLLEKMGMKKSNVTMLDVGADSAGITAVETGAADLTIMTEPFYSMQVHQGGKYKIVFYAKDVLAADDPDRGHHDRRIREIARQGIAGHHRGAPQGRRIHLRSSGRGCVDSVERVSFAAGGCQGRTAKQFAKIRQMVERRQF